MVSCSSSMFISSSPGSVACRSAESKRRSADQLTGSRFSSTARDAQEASYHHRGNHSASDREADWAVPARTQRTLDSGDTHPNTAVTEPGLKLPERISIDLGFAQPPLAIV